MKEQLIKLGFVEQDGNLVNTEGGFPIYVKIGIEEIKMWAYGSGDNKFYVSWSDYQSKNITIYDLLNEIEGYTGRKLLEWIELNKKIKDRKSNAMKTPINKRTETGWPSLFFAVGVMIILALFLL